MMERLKQLGRSLEEMDTSKALSVAEPAHEDAGPAQPHSIATPQAEEMARRRLQPTSERADMASAARDTIEGLRRKREAIEAFHTTQTEKYEGEFASRERARQKAVEEANRQIEMLLKASADEADAKRERIASIEAQCKEQTRALDDMIRAQELVVRELTK